MEFIQIAITWITLNGPNAIAALVAVHAAALAIVNLTPTPDDNLLVGKFYKLVEFMAGIFGGNAKLLPGEPATPVVAN